MIYVLSLLGIILEVSLPFRASIFIVTLSFLVYLIALKEKNGVVWLGGLTLILSLQTNDFFKILIVLLVFYHVMNFLFLHLAYTKANILIFTLFQGVVYWILSWNNFHRDYLVVNIIGFLVMNYIYTKVLKNLNRGIEG